MVGNRKIVEAKTVLNLGQGVLKSRFKRATHLWKHERHKTMKKTLAYITTAILLGLAVMMLPLALENGAQPQFPQPGARTQSTEAMNQDNGMLKSYGLANQPSNLLPSSLVLLSGLIVAITAYAIFRRRIL